MSMPQHTRLQGGAKAAGTSTNHVKPGQSKTDVILRKPGNSSQERNSQVIWFSKPKHAENDSEGIDFYNYIRIVRRVYAGKPSCILLYFATCTSPRPCIRKTTLTPLAAPAVARRSWQTKPVSGCWALQSFSLALGQGTGIYSIMKARCK